MRTKTTHISIFVITAILLVVFSNGCETKDPLSSNTPAETIFIDSISPKSGNGGNIVKIFGSGFGADAAGITIKFGQIAVRVISLVDTIITVEAPSIPGSYAVSFFTGTKVTISKDSFLVYGPRIINYSPKRGGLTSLVAIQIDPLGLQWSSAIVRINGYIQEVLSHSLASINLQIIKQGKEIDSGLITIELRDASDKWIGYLVSQDNFILADAPVIDSVYPMIGKYGDTIEVFGKQFSQSTVVSIGSIKADIVGSVSRDKIRVRVPVGAVAAPLKVEFYGHESYSSKDFIVANTPEGYFYLEVNNLRVNYKVAEYSLVYSEVKLDTTYNEQMNFNNAYYTTRQSNNPCNDSSSSENIVLCMDTSYSFNCGVSSNLEHSIHANIMLNSVAKEIRTLEFQYVQTTACYDGSQGGSASVHHSDTTIFQFKNLKYLILSDGSYEVNIPSNELLEKISQAHMSTYYSDGGTINYYRKYSASESLPAQINSPTIKIRFKP